MKKLKLVNLGKGLNRNEMKLVVGGDPGAPGTCQGVWINCLCMGPTGPTTCRVCSVSGSGQC